MNGRIIKGVGGLYRVLTDQGEYDCVMRGIFRKKKLAPYVGDLVKISLIDGPKDGGEDFDGSIEEILPRKNTLLRPKIANVDQLIIIFAFSNPPTDFELLDKMLVLAEENEILTRVCFTKKDLGVVPETVSLYESAGYQVLSVSTLTGDGMAELSSLLQKRITVLSGPSGVGKSSIINHLMPHRNVRTNAVGRTDRGRHTTSHSELMLYDYDSWVVDSPGFSSLSLELPAESLDSCFREFRPFIGGCRFADCRHINEPFCAIKEQIGQQISMQRYKRYAAFYEEISSAKKKYP